MLAAQIENRKAIASTNELIPETCRNIRTIRLLSCEYFMKKKYAAAIKKSFQSMEKQTSTIPFTLPSSLPPAPFSSLSWPFSP